LNARPESLVINSKNWHARYNTSKLMDDIRGVNKSHLVPSSGREDEANQSVMFTFCQHENQEKPFNKTVTSKKVLKRKQKI